MASLGNSLQQAQEFYNGVIKVLDEETSQNANTLFKSSYSYSPIAWGEGEKIVAIDSILVESNSTVYPHVCASVCCPSGSLY